LPEALGRVVPALGHEEVVRVGRRDLGDPVLVPEDRRPGVETVELERARRLGQRACRDHGEQADDRDDDDEHEGDQYAEQTAEQRTDHRPWPPLRADRPGTRPGWPSRRRLVWQSGARSTRPLGPGEGRWAVAPAGQRGSRIPRPAAAAVARIASPNTTSAR